MSHPQTQDDKALVRIGERYEFTNGWTMRRSVFEPYNWMLFDADRNPADQDRYRHDIIERHGLTVAIHHDPSALTALRNHEGRK